MRFDILTIFPQLLDSPLQEGIIRRAVAAGKISVNIHDIRDFALDKHAMTDDRPFGPVAGLSFFLPRAGHIPKRRRKDLRPTNISSCFAAGMKGLMRGSGHIMWMKRSPLVIISLQVES
jgi:hypothetical protein